VTDAAIARSPVRRVALALLWGALCHGAFALGGAAMFLNLWHGMRLGQGTVPQPWAWAANLALLAQFPLAHSLLLTPGGQRLLARLAPAHGRTLATTTYALIASLQLLALFALWTPSGVVWWRAEGWALYAMSALYLCAWGFLTKASFDAGPTVQSGLLGWWSLLRGRRPVFPPMPERGLFRPTRQPIYLGFALTLWTVPVLTPDHALLAVAYTAYCLLGPLHKERRFARLFGPAWAAYRARTPYWLPRPRRPAAHAAPERGAVEGNR
jgi:protein-S-isoprenylcysteine O-methyltransferase Ste14